MAHSSRVATTFSCGSPPPDKWKTTTLSSVFSCDIMGGTQLGAECLSGTGPSALLFTLHDIWVLRVIMARYSHIFCQAGPLAPATPGMSPLTARTERVTAFLAVLVHFGYIRTLTCWLTDYLTFHLSKFHHIHINHIKEQIGFPPSPHPPPILA